MIKSLLLSAISFSYSAISFAQAIPAKLQFTQGQKITITVETNSTVSQQAMGQAIDFAVGGTAVHAYDVTNVTAENATLHHSSSQIKFSFDGMGNKKDFDSNNPRDLNGDFGTAVKEILGKTFDIIIDANGKTLLSKPEKVALTKEDDRTKIIMTMLKDLTDVIQPPVTGTNSFFGIIPANATTQGATWSTTEGDWKNNYTIGTIADSTISIDFNGTAKTTSKAEMMGMETVTNMNLSQKGVILVDKVTGIIREQTTNIESNGTTEVMGNSLPVVSKATVRIKVK